MTTYDTKDCCQKARAEMAQEVVDILRAQAKKTISREALMALEAVEGAVLKARDNK